MQEFIEFVVKHLVKEPDQVRVTRLDDERRETYELEVAEGDIGRVIGKKGGNARALRTLLQAASSMQGQRSALIIKEDHPAGEGDDTHPDDGDELPTEPDEELPEL